MSVSDGVVFTMGNRDGMDFVHALDSDSGKQLWEHSYPCVAKDPNNRPGPRCTPTVSEGRVYTVSRQGDLFCLNAARGNVLWSKHLVEDLNGSVPKWGYSTSPLVVADTVIVEPGGHKGVLGFFSTGAATAALNKKTGEVIWSQGTESAGYSSPVAFEYQGETIIATFHADALVARGLEGGERLWSLPWKTSYDVNAATPIVSGTRIFISSGYNTGAAVIDFQGNEPTVVWRNRKMRNHFSSSVLIDGYLYGFDRNALKCLDFQTGKEQWKKRGYGKGALIGAGNRLIIQGQRGLLAVGIASPREYEEISRAQVFGGKETWVPPVLANGKIYCRYQERLVCFDVGNRKR